MVIIIILLVMILVAVGGGGALTALMGALFIVFGFVALFSFSWIEIIIIIVFVIGSIWLMAKFVDEQSMNTENADAEQRQLMLNESKKIEERIYKHSTGLFILKGKRGGSKIYKTINGARKARDR